MTVDELELELKEHITKTASRMLVLLEHIEKLETWRKAIEHTVGEPK